MSSITVPSNKDLQELSTVLRMNRLNVPADRLPLILEEYCLLRGQMRLINQLLRDDDYLEALTTRRPWRKNES